MSAYQIMLLVEIGFKIAFACAMFFIAGYLTRFRGELKEKMLESEEKLKAMHNDIKDRSNSRDNRDHKSDLR